MEKDKPIVLLSTIGLWLPNDRVVSLAPVYALLPRVSLCWGRSDPLQRPFFSLAFFPSPHRIVGDLQRAAGTPPEEWKGKEESDAAGTGSMAPKAETLTRQRKQHAETVSCGAQGG